MATATVAPGDVGARSRGGTAWQVARWVTLGLYAVTVIVAVLTGARVGTFEDLQSDLARGAVSQVRVEGFAGAPTDYSDGVQGVTMVRLVWQDGWRRSAAEVQLASSVEELEAQGFDSTPGTFIIGDVDRALREFSPDVEVVGATLSNGIYSTVGGWELRGMGAYLPGVLIVTFLLVLVNAPEPRLATRWAWVWLTFSPAMVIAVPAFLLVGARGQVPGRRRITGVVAFLIVVLLL
ncbi:hypothetical protein FNH13_09100 [Ornithinimicrobium ciconiae]|uniref:Uncharacterized protein n=1 Tax=Ornithinimicrobium ciconiae TaxID=2594265 RepID=A0A516GAF6_9MICO|nr:hypothetical protein [Ornithinimicrobium ciconiae]QDO88478.1 hypothetical protein FNH13_09100 [Ornithinimicrobium ciconiae]